MYMVKIQVFCAVFPLHNGVEKVRFIEGVLASTMRPFPSHFRLILIRILDHVPLDEGNPPVVSIFGNRRLICSISQCRTLQFVIVDSEKLLRAAMVVIDPYWVKTKFGILTRFEDIDGNRSTQVGIRVSLTNNCPIYKKKQQKERKCHF